MKIGILSDIHGNDAALKVVLEFLKSKGVKTIWALGDFVGYYYHPEKVLSMLGDFDLHAIRGNHEQMLMDCRDGKLNWEVPKQKYGSGLELANRNLSDEQINWLTTLPIQLEIQVFDKRILLCHGSPFDPDAYVYPDAPDALISKCRLPGFDLVLMGHTHYSFVSPKEKECSIANPGSVGQNRRNGGNADFMVLNADSFSLIQHALPYETGKLAEECRRIDPHLPYLRNILTRNHEA